MPLPPARLLAAALAAAALLTVSGCLSREPDRANGTGTDAPSTGPGSAAAPALTAAQAQSALITETDLGGPWTPTEGTATWRDGLLKATTNVPDCQRLLDVLYSDELLGDQSTTPAVVALDDGDDQAQLRYQVATRHPADVDRTLAWMRTLPQRCEQFTAATTAAGLQYVQVTNAELPVVGDARQGLRVTLTGQTTNDGYDPVTLTLDVAAVRVGDDTIALTNGALGTEPSDVTRQALEVGVQRLTQVRRQTRVQA
ncbi:hypothetical protein [Streptomyces brasiliensis]|uniref:PknH-like extracellular domain-containing protein n=1 Tax=Streptomyces brasiliensis TaxID=1954 RepID=A0A917KKT3_9ACTN|nr:hypothetical protein [Streptomyces brasiliensis]GGJ16185.1 hypothetical protein GCM10010121_028570 [Streptomyces brasiliensis]